MRGRFLLPLWGLHQRRKLVCSLPGPKDGHEPACSEELCSVGRLSSHTRSQKLPLSPLPTPSQHPLCLSSSAPLHSSSSSLRSALYLKLLCSSRSHQQDLVFDGRLTEEKFHPLFFWESIRSVFQTQILNLAFLVTCESSWLCWNCATHIWSVFSYQHYWSLFSLNFMGWKGFFPLSTL